MVDSSAAESAAELAAASLRLVVFAVAAAAGIVGIVTSSVAALVVDVVFQVDVDALFLVVQ